MSIVIIIHIAIMIIIHWTAAVTAIDIFNLAIWFFDAQRQYIVLAITRFIAILAYIIILVGSHQYIHFNTYTIHIFYYTLFVDIPFIIIVLGIECKCTNAFNDLITIVALVIQFEDASTTCIITVCVRMHAHIHTVMWLIIDT